MRKRIGLLHSSAAASPVGDLKRNSPRSQFRHFAAEGQVEEIPFRTAEVLGEFASRMTAAAMVPGP